MLRITGLKFKNRFLGPAIILKSSVAVQMVGRQIRNQRNRRRSLNLGELVQLKITDFQHNNIVVIDLIKNVQHNG